ncbi:MAG: DUF493 domain-containing protein [Agarilytica sp.]
MSKQGQEPPKIEFPCPNYPIKVMGKASEEYREAVLEIIEVHAAGFDRTRVRIQDSSKGTFHSLTVYIEATGVDQLKNIFEDLKKHPSTKMVL